MDDKDFAQPIDQRVSTHLPYAGPTMRAAYRSSHRERTRAAGTDRAHTAQRSDLRARVGAAIVVLANEFGTADARYKVHHDTLTSEVLVSQYEVESGAWVKLGAYELDEAGASVSSTDAAGDPGDRIDWSDMRWTAIASIPPNVETDGSTTTVSEPSISGSEALVSRFAGVGYGESLWVASAQGQSGAVADTATWSASLTAGEYMVEVYIPETHREAAVGYTLHTAEGDRTVVISQPVTFTTLQVHSGPHDGQLGPADIYSITALHPSSKALTLRYKCGPCLLIPDPLRLRRNSQKPETRSSNAEGNLRNFLNQSFYKGTVLQVEVLEPGHRSLRYTYRFPGNGKRPPPTICAVAATRRVGTCAS